MYLITKQEKQKQKYYNQKSKRWFLDKDKATAFVKNIEAQKVAGILDGAVFAINAANGKKTRKQFSRRGKDLSEKKVQILVNLRQKDIDTIGGSEAVKAIIYDAIKAKATVNVFAAAGFIENFPISATPLVKE